MLSLQHIRHRGMSQLINRVSQPLKTWLIADGTIQLNESMRVVRRVEQRQQITALLSSVYMDLLLTHVFVGNDGFLEEKVNDVGRIDVDHCRMQLLELDF